MWKVLRLIMSGYKIITSKTEAFAAWDRKSVIVREDHGYYFVYPMISRGYKYPNFDLKRECCLNTFMSSEKAFQWSSEKGYSYTLLRSAK